MAKRLTADQRNRVAEKVMDWGNLVFIGLVITQILTPSPLNLAAVAVGIAGIGGAYLFAVALMKGGGRQWS